MPLLDRNARLVGDAERRAVERLLDVVDRERVSREDRVDVAGTDDAGEIGPRAGVDDDRPGDDDDPFASRLDLAGRKTEVIYPDVL